MGALILKLVLSPSQKILSDKASSYYEHEGPSFNSPSKKTSDMFNNLLTLLFSSSFTPCSCLSGTESGRWSKICCLRETSYYLNRAEAIGSVWEKGMRLRSAV